MSFLQTGFTTPWEIRTPALTRYLEKEFVELFFKEGKLRLSSFKAFRNNPDEQRGDPFEGRATMQITAPNGRHTILTMNGQAAYILCAGTVENKNMEASFKTECGFRILNPLGFANVISRHIPGFVFGMEGLCYYREERSIDKHDEKPIISPDSYPDPEAWGKEYDLYVREQTKEAYFLKHISYSHQGEYRFIWFAGGEEKDYIDITCPEAVRFCQPLNM
jgi:hypothetical protein